jgi:hypothetical protein
MHPVLTFGLPRRLCLIGRLEDSAPSVLKGDVDLPCGCETLGKGEIRTFPTGTVMVEVEVEELGWAIGGENVLSGRQADGVQEFKVQATIIGQVGDEV